MQNLKEIVDYYLKSNTNYALMITGEWGIGKTYYFKNILSKEISQTSTYNDDSKTYRPILVSLFGLKSIEEIQSEIFLCLYPILKNNKLKLGASIGKAVAKGMLHFKGLGEYTKYIEEINVNTNDFINFDELVLCFDDLERISENLKLEELIGYINSLVENENVKVVIIANENKIDIKNYHILKEKVVGNSIEYISSIENTFDSLIEVKFSGYHLYTSFLIENKSFIIDVFSKKSKNIRILSYCLSYFQDIFSKITSNLNTENILKEKEKEIFQMLLRFSIAISIEYKEGNISYSNRNSLGEVFLMDLDFFFEKNNFPKDKEQKEKTYIEQFNTDYFEDKGFVYFKSIYDFLTGGNIFNYEDVLNELNKHYNIAENKIQAHYEVLNNLNYHNCYSLTDREYLELTKKIIEFSSKGLYEISEYLSIFYYVSRFNNPLNYNLENLEKKIIRGMKKGKANYKFTPSLDFYLRVDENSVHKTHLENILAEILRLNEQILQEEKKSKAIDLESKCYENFTEFFTEVIRTDKEYLYNPIMKDFNSYKFYKFFLSNDNQGKWEIIKFLSYRYKKYENHLLKPELLFFQELEKRIEHKCKKIKKGNLSGFLFNEFNVKIKDTIEILKG
ncbi:MULTISPECIES: KAP family NTPase [Flavobacterium]|uniref:KAP family NTPase n=1 Tax=Flavobacterium keumense TaxID=1306518 RepID=A0ABY8N4H3_9FLAO|nr:MULTISPECIES: KAP family NTPase [Flavobacterium]WGK94550.1 KAP family NTPase [Flavobacterium keumense]